MFESFFFSLISVCTRDILRESLTLAGTTTRGAKWTKHAETFLKIKLVVFRVNPPAQPVWYGSWLFLKLKQRFCKSALSFTTTLPTPLFHEVSYRVASFWRSNRKEGSLKECSIIFEEILRGCLAYRGRVSCHVRSVDEKWKLQDISHSQEAEARWLFSTMW